ncbi:hypothetical protein J7T55_014722 [Diaporthe amygdali]|uniref:uncharacterized protein n=1 Tax=Phomopsis amygdali TaxID=1214568 RepID=UPI0022FED958|nr:uncharacterized protein J7T55_014722 [Diaporthe amygdali]KAJ0109921.1 hypothetical protein J7T55_014722 [Diaporthe amygdali]
MSRRSTKSATLTEDTENKPKSSGPPMVLQAYLATQNPVERRLMMGKEPEDVNTVKSRVQATIKKWEKCFNGHNTNVYEGQDPSNKAESNVMI